MPHCGLAHVQGRVTRACGRRRSLKTDSCYPVCSANCLCPGGRSIVAVRLPQSPSYPRANRWKGHLHSRSEPLLLEPTDMLLSLWPWHPALPPSLPASKTMGTLVSAVCKPPTPQSVINCYGSSGTLILRGRLVHWDRNSR